MSLKYGARVSHKVSLNKYHLAGQRITTIQLDGVQYFISRMNPYSPELNYFLAYQYCRSIGLQLASFESKEKADSMTQYLLNAGKFAATAPEYGCTMNRPCFEGSSSLLYSQYSQRYSTECLNTKVYVLHQTATCFGHRTLPSSVCPQEWNGNIQSCMVWDIVTLQISPYKTP